MAADSALFQVFNALHSIAFIVLAAVGSASWLVKVQWRWEMKDTYAGCCLIDLLRTFGSAEVETSVVLTMSPLLAMS